MRDGRAGLGHPPWQGGGGGQQGGRGGFLKGSERPEAGCLGEFYSSVAHAFRATVPGRFGTICKFAAFYRSKRVQQTEQCGDSQQTEQCGDSQPSVFARSDAIYDMHFVLRALFSHQGSRKGHRLRPTGLSVSGTWLHLQYERYYGWGMDDLVMGCSRT